MKKILVIEDTPDNRRIIRLVMERAGYVVVEAVNGAEGIEMARSERPDLILMDIQLPVIDGYEATRRLKADPELQAIPVIAVTSYALAGDEAKTREAGCNGYMAKPFSPKALLQLVQQFIG
jgi:two-component system cell cycle response regulator DivK